VRGPGGGYRVAADMKTISVSDIIRAVDEQIDATQCGGHENCHEDKRCMTHELWTALNYKILEYLENVSLAQLVSTQKDGKKVLVLEKRKKAA
jgi:Rrf2 family iron-sulfur cluster assembly transcriptional regulator